MAVSRQDLRAGRGAMQATASSATWPLAPWPQRGSVAVQCPAAASSLSEHSPPPHPTRTVEGEASAWTHVLALWRYELLSLKDTPLWGSITPRSPKDPPPQTPPFLSIMNVFNASAKVLWMFITCQQLRQASEIQWRRRETQTHLHRLTH